MAISDTKLAFTVKEACEATGLSVATFYRKHAAGEIMMRKVGRRTLILRADLEDMLASSPPLERR